MKKLCCLLLILFSLTAAAAEPVNKHERQAPEKKPPRQVLPKQKLLPSGEINKTEKAKKKPPEVKTFIPSEKIDADAVVSFPVDI